MYLYIHVCISSEVETPLSQHDQTIVDYNVRKCQIITGKMLKCFISYDKILVFVRLSNLNFLSLRFSMKYFNISPILQLVPDLQYISFISWKHGHN